MNDRNLSGNQKNVLNLTRLSDFGKTYVVAQNSIEKKYNNLKSLNNMLDQGRLRQLYATP